MQYGVASSQTITVQLQQTSQRKTDFVIKQEELHFGELIRSPYLIDNRYWELEETNNTSILIIILPLLPITVICILCLALTIKIMLMKSNKSAVYPLDTSRDSLSVLNAVNDISNANIRASKKEYLKDIIVTNLSEEKLFKMNDSQNQFHLDVYILFSPVGAAYV